MIVTVIWNDCNSHGLSDYNVQEVTLRDREDIKYHIEGVVRQAMREHGYDEETVNEAVRFNSGLVGIIKGKVEWLA